MQRIPPKVDELEDTKRALRRVEHKLMIAQTTIALRNAKISSLEDRSPKVDKATQTNEPALKTDKVAEACEELVPVESTMQCPITLEDFVEPVATPCGHIFSKEALVAWLRTSSVCPKCNGHLGSDPKLLRVFLQ